MVDKGREFNVEWLHKVISTASLIKNGEFMNSVCALKNSNAGEGVALNSIIALRETNTKVNDRLEIEGVNDKVYHNRGLLS